MKFDQLEKLQSLNTIKKKGIDGQTFSWPMRRTRAVRSQISAKDEKCGFTVLQT